MQWLVFVESDGIPVPRFRGAPGRKEVAQPLHNLIEVQMLGNQVGECGVAAGHGDLEPAAPDQS
jgi:hypothetical protein